MTQIERIRYMEQLLDKVLAAVADFHTLHEKYDEIREDITTLSHYYSSVEWKQDHADDEAGLLPCDLKRGVLSEDGIWNVLTDWDSLKKRETS